MEEMDDEQLAAAIYVMRTKASLGDQESADHADRLDAELKRRIGPTPSVHGSVETLAEPLGMKKPAEAGNLKFAGNSWLGRNGAIPTERSRR